jgi:predicted acylesterase/phospholipase RssA
MQKSRYKTALVLSGGGSKGAIEVGILKVILKKITPDVIIGTSIGALNAAVTARGNSPQVLEEGWKKCFFHKRKSSSCTACKYFCHPLLSSL